MKVRNIGPPRRKPRRRKSKRGDVFFRRVQARSHLPFPFHRIHHGMCTNLQFITSHKHRSMILERRDPSSGLDDTASEIKQRARARGHPSFPSAASSSAFALEARAPSARDERHRRTKIRRTHLLRLTRARIARASTPRAPARLVSARITRRRVRARAPARGARASVTARIARHRVARSKKKEASRRSFVRSRVVSRASVTPSRRARRLIHNGGRHPASR